MVDLHRQPAGRLARHLLRRRELLPPAGGPVRGAEAAGPGSERTAAGIRHGELHRRRPPGTGAVDRHERRRHLPLRPGDGALHQLQRPQRDLDCAGRPLQQHQVHPARRPRRPLRRHPRGRPELPGCRDAPGGELPHQQHEPHQQRLLHASGRGRRHAVGRHAERPALVRQTDPPFLAPCGRRAGAPPRLATHIDPLPRLETPGLGRHRHGALPLFGGVSRRPVAQRHEDFGGGGISGRPLCALHYGRQPGYRLDRHQAGAAAIRRGAEPLYGLHPSRRTAQRLCVRHPGG